MITRNDLLVFNNTESTDIIQGLLEIPFAKPPTYIPNVTFGTDFEKQILQNVGHGSQVIRRCLGRGGAKYNKATAANAFEYTHTDPEDSIVSIPLDDVISDSQIIREPVELARVTRTGAAKAEVVVNNVIAESQKRISYSLRDGLPETTIEAGTAVSAMADMNEFKDNLLLEIASLDYTPNTLAVEKSLYYRLLGWFSSGDFLANPNETAVKTGILGHYLGLNVVIDPNLGKTYKGSDDNDYKAEYYLYDSNAFGVYTFFQEFRFADAGSKYIGKTTYAQASFIQGYDVPQRTPGEGTWGLKRIYKVT